MKTNYPPLKSVLCVLALVGLLSCNDHRIPEVTPGAGRLRVKSITQELSDNKKTVSAFQYDGQGRLSMITAYQTPDSSVAPVERNVFTYDSQSRLTQVERKEKRGLQIDVYLFTYKPDSQINVIDYRGSDNFGGVWSASPKYNTANQIVGYSRSYYSPLLRTGEVIDFTNSGNNIAGASTTLTRSIVDQTDPLRQRFITTTSAVRVAYGYDTNINPFYGLPLIPAPGRILGAPSSGFVTSFTYYGGIANIFNLSRNNVLSAVTSGGQTETTIYSYTYNVANLPTKRVAATGSSVTETLYFEYEPY